MRRGFHEALQATVASPVAAIGLGLLGFCSAVISALADTTAAAITAAAVLVALTALLVYALRVEAAFDGPYKVLASETTWDLQDPDADTVVVTKRQQVRFYYQTPVVSDSAWNDTACDPFSDYNAEHGEKVGPTVRHGAEHHAIIQLHTPAQRGDERELVSYRTERDQFPKPHDEWVELRQTQHGPSALTVLFPAQKPPRNVRIWRSRHNRTDHVELPEEQGRKVYRLPSIAMKPGDQCILKWDWEPRRRTAPGSDPVSLTTG